MFSTLCSFSYTLLLTTSLVLPSIKATFSTDIINQTCKACSETAPSPTDFNYKFCSASLGSVSVAHSTNLPGLGLIALELAVENSTNTLSVITKMLQDDSESRHSQRCTDCLKTCLELYTDITAKLNECVADFVDMKYDSVFMWVVLIREATELCEEGFVEEGSESPSTFENYSLTQLCSIVLCIMENFLGFSSPLSNTLRII